MQGAATVIGIVITATALVAACESSPSHPQARAPRTRTPEPGVIIDTDLSR